MMRSARRDTRIVATEVSDEFWSNRDLVATSVPGAIAMPGARLSARLREGGRVVHTVAHHRDRAPLGLQPATVSLAVGQDARDDAVDPDLIGDVACRRLVIARQQDRLDAELAQLSDRISRRLA